LRPSRRRSVGRCQLSFLFRQQRKRPPVVYSAPPDSKLIGKPITLPAPAKRARPTDQRIWRCWSTTYDEIKHYLQRRLARASNNTPARTIVRSYTLIADLAWKTACLPKPIKTLYTANRAGDGLSNPCTPSRDREFFAYWYVRRSKSRCAISRKIVG
jgi:hypothetical protein